MGNFMCRFAIRYADTFVKLTYTFSKGAHSNKEPKKPQKKDRGKSKNSSLPCEAKCIFYSNKYIYYEPYGPNKKT